MPCRGPWRRCRPRATHGMRDTTAEISDCGGCILVQAAPTRCGAGAGLDSSHAETSSRDRPRDSRSERSRAEPEFYSRALVPLGFSQIGDPQNEGREIEFGLEEAPNFAISTAYPTGAPVHVAFAADRREQVDAFHAEALAAGGRENGPPGVRPSTPMTTTGLSCSTPTATTSRRCAAASRAADCPSRGFQATGSTHDSERTLPPMRR